MPYPLFHPLADHPPPLTLSDSTFHRHFPAEGDLVEFKQGLSGRKIQEAAVAFSNAQGGVVLIGVGPDGRVTGLPEPGEKSRQLHQALHEACNLGRFDVHRLSVDGRAVLVLGIDRRHEGFAQTSDGVVRIRRGASNPALIGPELSRFVASRAFSSFEFTPTGLDLGTADAALLERVRVAFDWPVHDVAERLREAGLVQRENGRDVLTVAGALHLVDEPSRLGCRAYIDIRRYSGSDTEPDRSWHVTGPVATQIEHATADILTELGSVSAILRVTRVEMPRLPPAVVREALANAVAHRSYEHKGSAVRIEIRPDEVTITSPGVLPEPVTVENIRHQQAARNSTLLRVLRAMGLAEDLGLGIDRIMDDMQAELLQPPTFREHDGYFTVALPLGAVVTQRERVWIRELIARERVDARAAPLVVHCARHGSVTNSGARAILGVDSVVARLIIQRLVAEGVFTQQGERGGAQYVISEGLGVPAHVRHADDELEAIILNLAAAGPVTNARLRDHTGLDRTDAQAVLQRLVAAGQLVQQGSKRGTHYLLP